MRSIESRSSEGRRTLRAPAPRFAALVLALAVAACGSGGEEQGEGRYPYEPEELADATEQQSNDLLWSLLGEPGDEPRARKRYLDLVKLSLADLLYEDDPVGRMRRIQGWDWPSRGYTMIGIKRLKHIEWCHGRALGYQIPGDYIEAGAWRGGATIFMRALLAVDGVTDRRVWVADSFEGMPAPAHPNDGNLDLSEVDELAVSVEEVKGHFRRYGLLDDRVVFLKGWFEDSLPNASIDRLAMLRVDADLYQSTMDALVHLYPKVSPGGCVIVDDYWVPACRQAVDEFRAEHGVEAELQTVDSQGVFWIKE